MDLAQQFAHSLRRMGIEPGFVRGFSIPNDQDTRKPAFAFLHDWHRFAASLGSKHILLFKSPQHESFWLSDNPLVFHNSFPYGDVGFESSGVEIYLPVSI